MVEHEKPGARVVRFGFSACKPLFQDALPSSHPPGKLVGALSSSRWSCSNWRTTRFC